MAADDAATAAWRAGNQTYFDAISATQPVGSFGAPNSGASSWDVPLTPLLKALELKGMPGYSEFDIGNPGTRLTPDQVAKLKALVDELRDLRDPVTGHLTQAALLVRALDRSGAAPMITIEGEFSGGTVGHGRTRPVNKDGTSYGAQANAINGRPTCALITLESPDAPGALAALAHEIGNATSIVTGQGNWGGDIENESTRLGNEVKYATGRSGDISDSILQAYVNQWNRYTPWIANAPKHY